MFDEVKGKLGFGLMRFPKKDGASDLDQVKKMVDLFMEAGFTYFDTAWAYGDSEDTIRQALVERYPRESFQLATKNASWIDATTPEEAKKQLDTSLERTGAGYIDYYLLHNLGDQRSKCFDDFGMWDWILEQKAAGRIRHAGFSAHCSPEELEDILTKHPEMEFVQLQVNYADWNSTVIHAGACYEVARKHGKPVIVMEPVKGGTLATPPESVQKMFKEANPSLSAPGWAIRFAASLEGVAVVLSGMSSVEQMQDNISFMKDFVPLSPDEQNIIKKARQEIENIASIPCTTCDYCAKVCPQNIGISGSFYCMNIVTVYNNMEFAVGQERWHTTGHGKARADECIKCGKCEEVCPQHIKIRDELEKVAETFCKK